MRQFLIVAVLSLLSVVARGAEIEDSSGRVVAIPDRVTRVMAAGPPASVVLYVLAPEKMIGWTAAPRPNEREFLLPSVRDLPELGRLTGRGDTANIEVVLREKPDLIFDFGSVNATYVSLAESDFRALDAGFDLPDGGQAVTALAKAAPGGAFDPRDVAKIAASQLGYKAEWVVERFQRYNIDWDISGPKLESLNPDAKTSPWFIIMNGGAANLYEFFVDLKNRPGWAQYLAQKLNVMIVTIPGNFKYGGWEQPSADAKRQPAYLLDRDLSMD